LRAKLSRRPAVPGLGERHTVDRGYQIDPIRSNPQLNDDSRGRQIFLRQTDITEAESPRASIMRRAFSRRRLAECVSGHLAGRTKILRGESPFDVIRQVLAQPVHQTGFGQDSNDLFEACRWSCDVPPYVAQ